jgi:hypothetical protein
MTSTGTQSQGSGEESKEGGKSKIRGQVSNNTFAANFLLQ